MDEVARRAAWDAYYQRQKEWQDYHEQQRRAGFPVATAHAVAPQPAYYPAYAVPPQYAPAPYYSYAAPVAHVPAPVAAAPIKQYPDQQRAEELRQLEEAKKQLRKKNELAAIKEQAEQERKRLAGEWPDALRLWLERSLTNAMATDGDYQARLQARLKQRIEESILKGDLWARDWAAEPLAWVPSSQDNYVAVPKGSSSKPDQGHARPSPVPPPPPPPVINQPAPPPPPVVNKPSPAPLPPVAKPPPAAASPQSEPSSSKPPKHASKPPKPAANKKSKLASAPPAPPPRSMTPEEEVQKQRRAKRFLASSSSQPRVEMTGSERTQMEAERVAQAIRAAQERGQELDLGSLVITGTCTNLEKPYLRLTSAPDPATVRPPEVLKKSLELVKSRLEKDPASYTWASEQLKSIRQDLSIQHVKSLLTVQTYETHARAALTHGAPDLQEFNQCVTQLMDLYDAGLCQSRHLRHEFAALQILYNLYAAKRFNAPASASAIAVALKSIKSQVEDDARRIWEAVELNDLLRFTRLLDKASDLFKALLRPLVPYIHRQALARHCKAARTLAVKDACLLLHISPPVFASYKARFGLVMAESDWIDCKASLAAMPPMDW